MIRSLYVKNFALVNELTIAFGPGLNIITGETGAGKSILINAMGQLCGERSPADLIRSGADKAVIEAEIQIDPSPAFSQLLAEHDLDIEGKELLIRKEIKQKGASRSFINDTPVTLNVLNDISAFLFDLHGQHQHQRLLHPENHIFYLDAFGDLEDRVSDYKRKLNTWRQYHRELSDLKQKQFEAYQKQDMFRYQDEELSKADLQEGELEELKNEGRILANVEDLHQYGSALSQALYSGEPNAGTLISDAEDNLERLSELDEQFAELKESLISARTTIEEIGRFADQYLANLEYNPERLEQIQQRIAHLEFLLKKYQKYGIEELIEYHNSIRENLDHIEAFDDAIKEKENEIRAVINEVNQAGQALIESRTETGKRFAPLISNTLQRIGMPQAHMRVRQDYRTNTDSPFKANGHSIEALNRGFDQITFEIAANTGEPHKPLHKVASGGELSRIMLALKSTLAEVDQIPSLVFDEIDVGISGKVAQIVGQKLSELTHSHQLICVTHLPQIAAFADSHYRVSKRIFGDRTLIDMTCLDQEEQINEIAQLLGGKELSKEAIDNARHLLEEAKKLHTAS